MSIHRSVPSSRSGFGRVFLAATVAAMLAGCASPPKVDAIIDQPATPSAPKMVGARGPLTPQQSKAILARLQHESDTSDAVLERHLALQSALSDSPLVAGNKVELLRDGTATFPAIFQAVREARDHVHMEYFTFDDVQDGDQHMADLLLDKVRQGVAVSLIFDSYGSLETKRELFKRLKGGGVQVVEFNPLNPLKSHGDFSLNDRDHRKILIVDGTMAIIGGVNLDLVYMNGDRGSLPGMSSTKLDPKSAFWSDTDIRITGPAVAELQKLFVATWTDQKGEPLAGNLFPQLAPQGKEVIRILGSTPSESIPDYYVSVLSAIRNAEDKVWITTAYFVPTKTERHDLEEAARRGVDVRLLLPASSDSASSLAVQHSYYEDLLEAGVKIYERPNVILHSKSAVIDDVWSVIGSSNFDHRSVLFNNEVDGVILGRDTARDMEAMFEDDFRTAVRIDPVAWSKRPVGTRLKEFYSRFWKDLL